MMSVRLLAACAAALVLNACHGSVKGNPGSVCEVNADCPSNYCGTDSTCHPVTCSDGIKNGDETDVDCGGSCAACGAAGPTCTDGIKNGNETGVDCGGSCAACQAGGPLCTDGIKNGDETGVDCGGSCSACAIGDPCLGNTDCTSTYCAPDSTCQTPLTCTDGIKNGNETGVDCGGSCSACADGDPCLGNTDCQSAYCATDATCQTPTCTDTVQNGNETGVDCGGVDCIALGLTCPSGTPCGGSTDCSSGFCNGTCQLSSCSPPDGIKNGSETDIDCGGPNCPSCSVNSGCTSDADCSTGFCSGSTCVTPSCGDGVINGTEDCDGSDLNGQTCVTEGFTTGTLSCSASCAFNTSQCSGGCGNGQIDSGEQCDGLALGGATCTSLGYTNGGSLACSSGCSYDASGCSSTACPPSCPAGSSCSAATNYHCQCPLFETACGASCLPALDNPDNCGACGHACTGSQACADGVCVNSCPAPLMLCNRRCIDPQTDSTYCGGCAAANDCTTNGQVCLSGACAAATPGRDYSHAGDADSRCVGGGAPLDLNTGLGCDPMTDANCVVPPSLGCTGDLAQVTFRYALCSCTDINTSHPLFADGFDSATGPYVPHCEDGSSCTVPGSDNAQCTVDSNGDGHTTCFDDKGAGVGCNGTFSDSQLTTVWGTLWMSNGNASTYTDQRLPTATVEQELHVGKTLSSSGSVRVRGDGYVVGNVTATGAFNGTLHQSSGATSSMAAASYDRSANPLVVPEACDCAPSKLINVPAIVDAHACNPQGTAGCSGAACCATSNNNNSGIALDPTILDNKSTDVRVDLPCGNYDFTNISAGSNTTVTMVVHGRTAIYVDGNIDIPKILNITMDDSSELDVFVKGGVCNNGTLFVGSPLYPARVRFYVGGGTVVSGGSGTTCATNQSRSVALKTIIGAANFYAPYGEVYMPQTFTLYGSIFAGNANIVQDATIHFDTGISSAGNTCQHCGNGSIDPGEQCDGSALAGNTCASLGYNSGALTCTAACTFNTSACCGDNIRDGSEQCDGTDLNGQTCASLGKTGTLSCSPSCTFQGCDTALCNPDGTKSSTEQCDPGPPSADFGGATCSSVLGFPASGSLACTAACGIDTSGCTYCGDGLVNGSETCDGNDFDPAAGVQSTPPACTSGTGAVTCSSACALDTSSCTGCASCRDCNNQACVSGVCGACTTSSDCCAPLQCFAGTCTLF